jgi:uncharacterized membrane protein
MAFYIAGLVLFIAVHLFRVIAPGARQAAIASLGQTGFRACFGVASLASLVLLIYGFGIARQETPILYVPPFYFAHITILLMLFAFIILVSGFLPSGYIATWTKHPQVLAIKIWAVAHLLANGEAVQVSLFAAILAWAVILRISYKRRAAAGDLTPRVYKSWTYDLLAVVIGLAIYGLFLMKLHLLLIGVPIPMG